MMSEWWMDKEGMGIKDEKRELHRQKGITAIHEPYKIINKHETW